MSVKPKPKWNAAPHPSQALREGKADGCQLVKFVSVIGGERPLWVES